jgi:hypothetical protein
MEKSNKRGKIPQSDWPQIMARYEAGETLASIAKTYDCSPPAISYIVSRSRARHTNGHATPAATEPQLVKAHPHTPPDQAQAAHAPGGAPPAGAVPFVQNGAESIDPAPLFAHGAALPRFDRGVPGHDGNSAGFGGDNGGSAAAHHDADRNSNDREAAFPGLPPAAMQPAPMRPAPIGTAQPNPVRPNPTQTLDDRRRLHLGFGNGGTSQPNGTNTAEPRPGEANGGGAMTPDAPRDTTYSSPPPATRQQQGGGEPDQPQALRPPRTYDQPRYGYGQVEQHQRPGNSDVSNKALGSYIDKELRARVDTDIAAFLSAFDAALAQDTQSSRSALREATDRLLRAGARTRIELERLEARVPLPARDAAFRSEPASPAR